MRAGSKKGAQQYLTRGRLDVTQAQRLRDGDCVSGEQGPVFPSSDSSPGPFPAKSSRKNRKRDLAEGQNLLFTPYMYSALSSKHHAYMCAWGEEGGYEEAQGKLLVPRAMSLEVGKKKKKQDSGPESPG